MKKAKILLIPGVIITTLVAGWCISRAVFANGSSGSGDDLNKGCVHYCTSWGAGWHYEDLGTFAGSATGPGMSAEKKQEILSECAGTGGVYRHSFEYFTGKGGSVVPGKYKGLANQNEAITITSGGGEDPSSVEAKFRIAESYGVTKTTWGDTAWFCYDINWGGAAKPPTRPTPSAASGDGHFWSQATVTAQPGGDVPGGITATTGIDGTAEIKYSSDQDSVTVVFEHIIGYDSTKTLEITEDSEKHKDTVDDVDTSYTISQYMSVGGNSTRGSGGFGNVSNNTTVDGKKVFSESVDVSLNPGQTVMVCQTVSYTNKNFSFEWNKTATHYHKYDSTSMSYGEVIDLGNYVASGSGSGNSRVCATITRPSDPSGSGPTGPSGGASSNVMFAGETSTIGWNVSGPNYDVRRLKEYQGIVYNYDVNYNYSSSLVTGDSRSSRSPCSYYGGKGASNCGVIDGIAGSFGEMGSSHGFSESRTPIIPDYVGRKYCHSWGYRYEYYYYSSSKGWFGPYNGYWYNYNSSCRTIAKKPSVSIWNGSTLTNGGVKTSLSWRYDDAVMGKVADSSSHRLYGSWSEYLDVIGKAASGFASGSTLSIGSLNEEMLSYNSPLTIANNTTTLGGSGVQTNSALRTRLITYLRNRAEVIGDTISGMSNVSGTHIYHRKGDLNITGNITLNTGNYGSIYDLPQVIIFVDGNVNISSNVTQIDAWIIAGIEDGSKGIINTCNEFGHGVTEADAVGRFYGNCTQQLVFNGLVLANKMLLYRSFGSDPLVQRYGTFNYLGSQGSAWPAKYNSAEIFNLDASTYLWAYAQAGRYDSSYTESYSRELAPRY